MTFLLQKFNAINRTRTEVPARNGLRPTASGIAFTGRLAVVCLLLAGFLGVGSAIAQAPPTVLRVGGGSVTVALGNNFVHHYVLGDDAVNDPLGGAEMGTFIVGTIASVSLNAGMLTVTPISSGNFKVAGDTGATAPLTTRATPVFFEVMSRNAPSIVGISATGYNAASHVGTPVNLKINEKKSMSVEHIDEMFTGGSGLGLTYRAMADPVKRDDPDSDDADDMISVDIVTASTGGTTTLTIALTAEAAMPDADVTSERTDVWLFATDDAGEYARMQIAVMVGPAESVHLAPAAMREGERVLRENAELADYNDVRVLTGGFVDPPDFGSGTPHYSVSFDAGTAVPNKDAAIYTVVISAMTVEVMQGSQASYQITDVRGTGEITFTVKATDFFKCPAGYGGTGDQAMTPTSVDQDCNVNAANGTPTTKKAEADYSKGDMYPFTVKVITKSTPMATANMPNPPISMAADADTMMVDLEDLDSVKAEAQPAFEDPTDNGLTYMVELDEAIATVSVDSSGVIAIVPFWHSDATAKTATLTVTAENDQAETEEAEYVVTVRHAVSPVLNEKVALAIAAGYTLMLKTGDRATMWNLMDLTSPLDPTMMIGPLFTNPLPESLHGVLPGGMLYEMGVEADHKSAESTKNNVITSAMTITLDPEAATLTITPTGANSAEITIMGTNRSDDATPGMVTIPVTVVSCDGVDMSGPCAGVATGTENEELPTEVSLSQNYPNPFNPQTTIDYALPKAGDVSLVVYDMLGREVDVLLDGPQAAGRHTVRFGANHLPNGTYVYRLVAADKTITRTMVLVK